MDKEILEDPVIFLKELLMKDVTRRRHLFWSRRLSMAYPFRWKEEKKERKNNVKI